MVSTAIQMRPGLQILSRRSKDLAKPHPGPPFRPFHNRRWLTHSDKKNFKFLHEECLFYRWILVNYKDDMLSDSLKTGYPLDTPVKALGIWLAMISGSDLYAERTPAEVDEKIFLLRPYVFACFRYDMTYAEWHHRRLPLCKTGCTDHPAISSYTAQYNRFGHSHLRAPPHFVLGAYLCYMRLLERQPGRIGIKATSSTSFLDEAGTGLFSVNQLMPSVYHDPEWQRNTVCQDPHTSPGLPPLTFHGRLQGFWRARLLVSELLLGRVRVAPSPDEVPPGVNVSPPDPLPERMRSLQLSASQRSEHNKRYAQTFRLRSAPAHPRSAHGHGRETSPNCCGPDVSCLLRSERLTPPDRRISFV